MKILYFLLFFGTFIGVSQNNYPTDYFRSPLDIPLILSGTFGELRSNHFHSGIDIKTQGKEGLKIYAIADGYVSRIKVQQYGYGKAIYITHPNGYTSVYGHLSEFNKEINSYITALQYKKKNYQTGNLYFDKNKFVLKKGDVIGFTGDTGSSGGPHLHFEIRDTKTEHIINPLFFGINIPDTKKPTIRALHVYPLADNARVNQQHKSFKLPIKRLKNGVYKTGRLTANGPIGFGINTIDKLNGAPNKNGVYSIEVLVNGKRHYYHSLNTFSFAESKYLNLLIDYGFYKTYKSKLQRTFKTEGNKLSIYKDVVNNGKITIKEGLDYAIKIIVKDFANNTSTLEIPVKGVKNNALFTPKKTTTPYKIDKTKFNKFTKKNVTVAFPKLTFYKDIYLDFKVNNGVAEIHKNTVPLNKSFTLTFNVSKFTDAEREKLYIADVTNPKYANYKLTRKRDSTFFTTTKTLGKYTLKKDTKAPSVKILYIKNNQWISNQKTLKVKVTDYGAGIKNWRAILDGKWALMHYNHKKNILTYNFSDLELKGTKHKFTIEVVDHVGNTTKKSIQFYKKQAQ